MFELRSLLGIVSPDLLASCTTDATGRDVVLSGFFSSTRIFPHHSPSADLLEKSEAVLARNPDVILVAAIGADGARQTLEWNHFQNLQAVRSHHVFTVDPSLVGRMAPRILQGVREVCGLLDAARH